MITNRREGIIHFSQVDVPGFSKHDLIFYSYDIPSNPPEQRPFTYRDYDRLDYIVANEFLQSQFYNFFEISEVHDSVEFFNNTLSNCLDLCVPLKYINPSISHPWYSSHIKNLMNLRDKAYKIWKRSRTDAAWESYKSLRNQTTFLCRRAKMTYMNKHLSPSVSNKTLWKRLKKIGVCNSNDAQCQIPFSPDEVNHAFCNSSINLPNPNNPIPVVTATPIASTHNVTNEFSFRHVSQREVWNAVYSISSNATGNDNIPIKFIKCLLPWLITEITFLFNKIIDSNTFPIQWKTANVTPIPKTSNVKTIKDLRPISILPSLSKAFERIMSIQINEFLTEFNLLSVFQSGFRQNHGTETALITVCDDISSMLDEKHIAVLVLLDFSKAFDVVDHSLLLIKLRELYGFSPSAVSLIKSYLSQRLQTVCFSDLTSNELQLKSGVPQGSILGPLLFSLFINDLPNVLSFSYCHLYADDVQIYCSEKAYNINRMIGNLNEDLEAIYQWALRNHLIINPQKSQSILFCSSNFLHHQLVTPSVSINDSVIPFESNCKNLGVIIDSHFNWGHHIEHVCGKIYTSLRTLRVSAAFMNSSMRKKLVKTLIVPHITYCSSVLGKLSATNFNKLKKAYNACLRFVYGLNRYDSVSSFSYDLLGCSLETYLKFRICLKIHTILNNETLASLYPRFVPGSSARIQNLRIPRNRTRIRNDSFLVYGTSLYNRIPPEIKNTGMKKFKKEALAFLNSLV